MGKASGPVMVLCPKCKTIQKANTVCPNCTFPIPPKEKPVEEGAKAASIFLSRSLFMIKRKLGGF